MLSQYVADAYLSSLLETTTGGIGYLLKDRVGHVTEFLASLDRVAEGGTVVDPRWSGSCSRGGVTTDRWRR